MSVSRTSIYGGEFKQITDIGGLEQNDFEALLFFSFSFFFFFWFGECASARRRRDPTLSGFS